MHSPLVEYFPRWLQQSAMLLLSCLDDALIVSLSKLGVPLPGGQWLSSALLTITVLFWLYRIVCFCRRYERCHQPVISA